MVTEEDIRLVGRHLEAENAHNMEATLATLHPGCVFEDVALGKLYQGREGAREYYALWWSAFDLQVKGKRRHFSTEGAMIAETTYVGRHVGDFYGAAATQKPVELKLAVVIGFRDGLMDGERFYYDMLSLLRQIGVSPDTFTAAMEFPA
jgi:steroid delta-isomerase-like uncharacterized protein